jgi:SAM-dependent MidA family methyltransferase
MGIIQRVEQLIDADHVTEEEANMLFESMKKMVDPQEMGSKFKVMSIVHPSLEKLVAGFPANASQSS